MAASDYENDPFVNDRERAYYSDTFKVAGQPVEGHQVLTPRGGPRPPTPRGPHMDVTTSYPDGGNSFPGDRDRWYPREDTPFRVGGRPVEGHQVIRPPPPSSRMRTERGEHMRVTTSNPRFTRTDRPRRRDEYDDYRPRGRFRSRDSIDDVEDRLLEDEELDRLESRRRYGGRGRSAREMDEYDEMPHFLAEDDDVGLPIDREDLFDRDVDRRRERIRSGLRDFDRDLDSRFDMEDRDVPPVESVREREWRELEERRARRRPRLDRQDIQGLGRMPMQGEEWDDYRYPERRRAFERESRRFRDLESSRYFNDSRETRYPPRREERRPYFGDEREYDRDEGRRFDDEEGEYVRDGPHLVRRRWYNSGRLEDEEDYRPSRRELYRDSDRDRYYNDTRRSRYYSRNDDDRERLYEDMGRRDERGSVGGPMPEELLGVD